MAEGRVQRRLAAILAADVVSYSRLMEDDEEGTRARLRSLHSELIEPKIAADGGRIVKTTGDGILVEFASAVDAVRNALDIQRAMRQGNADVPENSKIEFRVGINVGDVIVEGDDIHGDGVNVAARLEGLCEPGTVYVSGTVYDQVAGKLEATFEDLGAQTVKNIAKPVRVYRTAITVDDVASLDRTTEPLPLPDRPSIAVLPFANLSGDADQEFFADGVAEDIITALSRIRQFFVIARNSSFTYKGRAVDVPSVARELGVRYVLEGSVRKVGSRVRITAQLIDGQSGNHVWAERYDRDLDDIFAIHDDITRTVVGQIEPEISRAEQERAIRRTSDNLDGWTLYQRGLWHFWRFKKDDLEISRSLFKKAIEADPNFAPPHAFLAYTAVQAVTQGFISSPRRGLDAALPIAMDAIAIDDRDALSHWALGGVQLWRREHKIAVSALERAINLNPSFAPSHVNLAVALMFDGRSSEAIPLLEAALRLSPNDPLVFVMFAMRGAAHLNLGEFEAAREWAEKARRRSPASNASPIVLMSALGQLDQGGYAKEVLSIFRERNPPLTENLVIERIPFGRQADTDLWLDGLRKAGVIE